MLNWLPETFSGSFVNQICFGFRAWLLEIGEKEGLSFLFGFLSYSGFHHYSGRAESQEENSEITGILNKVDERPYEAGTNGWKEQKQQNKQTFFGLLRYSIRRPSACGQG